MTKRKTENLTVSLPKAEAVAFRAEARQHGMSTSKYLRAVLGAHHWLQFCTELGKETMKNGLEYKSPSGETVKLRIPNSAEQENPRSSVSRGSPTPAIDFAKVGRNDPCPCGSGKKYKRCCGR